MAERRYDLPAHIYTKAAVFASLTKDFRLSYQIIFSPSSHGQRRSLPLMTTALIKLSGSLRTLTTWTEDRSSSHGCTWLNYALISCWSPCLCISTLREWTRKPVSGLWSFNCFAGTGGLREQICFLRATRDETEPTNRAYERLWWTQFSSPSFGTPVCMKTESTEMLMERN